MVVVSLAEWHAFFSQMCMDDTTRVSSTRYQLTRVAFRSLRCMASRDLGVGFPPPAFGCPDFLSRYLRTHEYMCVISLQHAAQGSICPPPPPHAPFCRLFLHGLDCRR